LHHIVNRGFNTNSIAQCGSGSLRLGIRYKIDLGNVRKYGFKKKRYTLLQKPLPNLFGHVCGRIANNFRIFRADCLGNDIRVNEFYFFGSQKQIIEGRLTGMKTRCPDNLLQSLASLKFAIAKSIDLSYIVSYFRLTN
jgi:hypothetical protein